MKIKILSLLVILGIMAVTPMIMTGKFDPMAFLGDGSSEFSKLKSQAPKNLSSVVSDEKVQVYKWVDEHGTMHFSSTPPATNNAEQIELNPNNNLIKAVEIPEKEEPAAVAKTSAPAHYSIKGMKKVMDDARGIEDMLQKRHVEQQKMMNNL